MTLLSVCHSKKILIMSYSFSNSYFNKASLLLVFLLLSATLSISCSSDDTLTRTAADPKLVADAKNFLSGDIVLSTTATMNGVNKTLLETGCPTKFDFTWSNSDPRIFTVSLLDFTVGKMGMIISFKCDVTTMQLNDWEKHEYGREGWIKFEGANGSVWGTDTKGASSTANGSYVKGYYDVNSHKIEFIVDYNMMNVRSECFLQTIDKSRINNFEAEFAQYEKDLAAYKKEHGL